ncbi:ABC transporter permease [Clostridium sp.]|uniref:ABC transporter permease n=1 Tax=Clostridium sp. TaxID=1506 RepID=UPI002FC6656B
MRYIAYLKIALKNLLAGWKTSLFMVIGLPMGLSLFLGTVYSVAYNNSEIPNVSITIYDEDETKYSKALIDFLSSQELKNSITIEDKGEESLKLIIPKGYEEKISALSNVEILYENDNNYFEVKIIKEILNSYHEGIYLSIQNLTNENIQELQKSSINSNLIEMGKRDFYKENSLMGISFAASMMIMMLVVAEYTPLAKNLNKKTSLAPISRNLHYNLEYFSNVIFILIMLFIYVLFYNITGLSFEGVLIESLVVIAGTAIFISSVYVLIVSFFKEKYGKIISSVIMILPLMFQVVFPQIVQGWAQFLSPVFVVNEAFRKLLEGNVFTLELGIMYLVSIILFFISREKVNYDWRMGK